MAGDRNCLKVITVAPTGPRAHCGRFLGCRPLRLADRLAGEGERVGHPLLGGQLVRRDERAATG